MRNAGRKLGLAGLLLAGITALSPVQAQDKEPTKIENIDSVLNTTEGDFMLVSSYDNKPINRNETTNLNARLKGGDSRKEVKPKIYAVAPQTALKREIVFLNSARAKKFYSQEQICDLRGRYQKFLDEFNKENVNPDKESLKTLSLGASDGMLYSQELNGVKDNWYAFVKEGYDSVKGNYSVFYLTRLTSDTTSSQYEAKINELEKQLAEISKSRAGKETPEASLEKISPEESYALPQVPKLQEEKPKKETVQPKMQKQETSRQEKDYRGLSLLTQGTMNVAADSYGASLGVRWNPFQNADIGFGANLDLGLGLDKQADSYKDVLTCRLSTAGSIKDTNKYSIGGSLEAQLGPFIIGGGIDYKNWVKESVAQIIKDDKVTKSNTDSVPNRQVFGKVYGGVEVPLGDNFRIGAIGGYNGKDGAYLGLRGAIKIK